MKNNGLQVSVTVCLVAVCVWWVAIVCLEWRGMDAKATVCFGSRSVIDEAAGLLWFQRASYGS